MARRYVNPNHRAVPDSPANPAAGTALAAARALGRANPAELGQIAKRSGVPAGQLEEWVAGRLELPADQTLVLVGLAQELALTKAAALNGAAR